MTGESYSSLISGGAIATNETGLETQSSATTITLANGAAHYQRVTFTAGGQSLRMPPANGYSKGEDWVIHALGANTFTVKDQSGTNTIITASPGSMYLVYIVDNASSDGTWAGSALAGGGASPGANSDILSLSGLTTPLTVGQGGTGLDADTTGGANQVVKQTTLGGAFTVAAIAQADLPVFTGDAGAGGAKGAVPAPAAGDAAAAKYLSAGGGWSTPSGSGASAAEAYVTVGNAAGLSAERALTAGSGITITDNGANSTVSVAVTVPVPATAANATNMLRVNAGATALEYRTPAQVASDIGAVATSSANVFTDTQTVKSTDAGAAIDKKVVLWRDSASPAANDLTMELSFDGEDNLSNQTTYASLQGKIIDPTDGSEDGELIVRTFVAGTNANRLHIGGGVYTTNATGGDKGIDTINASAIYDDNVQIVAASQAEMEAATAGAGKFVTAATVNYAPGVAKGWGYVTVAAGVPTLQASHNVTSITDTGTGRLTVTIATDFSSANYACLVTLDDDGTTVNIASVTSQLAGSFEINSRRPDTGALRDPKGYSFVFFGDQ